MTILNPQSLSSILTGESKSFGAAFTVKSNKTGKDFTFKVSRAEFNGKWFSHVRVEKEYMKFHYMGFFTGSYIIRKGQEVTTPAAVAANWLLKRVVTGGDLSGVTIYHTGRCLKCGRELTDATSIELGLGPVCRGYLNDKSFQ